MTSHLVKQDSLSLGVLLITHARPELFRKSLNAIIAAEKKGKTPIVVLHQISDKDYTNALRDLPKNVKYISIDGSSRDVEANINRNRIIGLHHLFEEMGLDSVLVVEDDIVIASDAFDFIEISLKKFKDRKFFRGINLGSRIPYTAIYLNTFSKLRYGFHGPASVITKRTWEKSKLSEVELTNGAVAWDGWLEAYAKTGYMITPNTSRYVDFGAQGTHTPNENEDSYFRELRESANLENQALSNLQYLQLSHNWRRDCKRYFFVANMEYYLRYLRIQKGIKKAKEA